MHGRRNFILTEAAAMIPLVRQLLVEVREGRARLAHLERQTHHGTPTDTNSSRREREQKICRDQLADALTELSRLGVEVSPGVRCEALFPFEHQWTGPKGDGKIRPAFFVFNDAQSTIDEWYFAGWPGDRRKVWPHWWQQFRAAA